MALPPKAIRRFYEPLIILESLDRVQGERIPPQDDLRYDARRDADPRAYRRAVLEQLCIVCDYLKGGFTVTAIALEQKPSGPAYWLASNEDVYKKILPFLRNTLDLLGSSQSAGVEDLTGRLFKRFVEFGRPWLKDNWKLLQKAIDAELALKADSPTHASYCNWLRSFTSPVDSDAEFVELCRRAYEARRSPHFPSRLAIQAPAYSSENPRSVLRHRLGRLGTRLRAAKLLAHAASSMPELFQDYAVEVCSCKVPIKPLKRKNVKTLTEFASRMLPSQSGKLKTLTEALERLSAVPGFKQRVEDNFRRNDPRVHAEIAVLESVYSAGVEFYDDDRFIAASKAACFCCYHYISHHPGEFVRPASHCKTYSQWSPAALGDPNDQDAQRRLARTMEKLTNSVRDAAIRRIMKQSGRQPWHPDSTSGITSTLQSLFIDDGVRI